MHSVTCRILEGRSPHGAGLYATSGRWAGDASARRLDSATRGRVTVYQKDATVARQRSEIDGILRQAKSLPANDQIALVRELMTPRLRLRLLVDQIRSQGHVSDERKIDRAVRRAVREVRTENRAARTRPVRAGR